MNTENINEKSENQSVVTSSQNSLSIHELDFLEKRLISTLSVCSIFNYGQIEFVYRRTKSFDKTILCLKLSASGISLNNSILEVMSIEPDTSKNY